MADDPFNPTEPDAIRARIDDLNRKRKARLGKPQFESNIAAIDEEVAKLEALLSEVDPQP